jgi:uncharacterized delta-60 repeat protein
MKLSSHRLTSRWFFGAAALLALLGGAQAQIAPDASFASGGFATTGLPAPFAEEWADVAVQPDGRVVAVGTRTVTQQVNSAGFTSTSSDFLIARFLSNGAPDLSFNGTGVVQLDFDLGFDSATSVVLLADGRVLVAGNSIRRNATGGWVTELALVRLNANGAVDPSFGTQGFVRLGLAAGGDSTVKRLLMLPNGSLRAVGDFSASMNGRAISNWMLTGLTANGAIDASFGTAGRATLVFGNGLAKAATLDALLVNDQIVVVGEIPSSVAGVVPGSSMGAARFSAATGALDATFGSNGVVQVSFPPQSGSALEAQSARATAVLARPDGRLVLLGDGTLFSSLEDSEVDVSLFAVGLTASGQIDSSFSAFPNYQIKRSLPALTLSNGQPVVTTQPSPLFVATPQAPIYTLADNGAVARTADAVSARMNRAATQLDGRVLVAGGVGSIGVFSADAALGRFELVGALTPPPPPAVTLPAAPTNLLVTSATRRAVSLAWRDNANNETRFTVSRSTAANFSNPVQLATLGANATSYIDNSVVRGTTYFYRVAAANAAGSATSGTVSATPR